MSGVVMTQKTKKPGIFADGFRLCDTFLIAVLILSVFAMVSAWHWSAQRTGIYYVWPGAFAVCAALALKPRVSIAFYALSVLTVLTTFGALGRHIDGSVPAVAFNLFLNPYPLLSVFGMCLMVAILWKKGQSVSRFGDYWHP